MRKKKQKNLSEKEKLIIEYLRLKEGKKAYPSDIAEHYNWEPLETIHICIKMEKKEILE